MTTVPTPDPCPECGEPDHDGPCRNALVDAWISMSPEQQDRAIQDALADQEQTTRPDIVVRLRSPEVFLTNGGMHSPVAEAAAIEIERLRAALTEMIVWFGAYPEKIPAPRALHKAEAAIKHAKQLLGMP